MAKKRNLSWQLEEDLYSSTIDRPEYSSHPPPPPPPPLSVLFLFFFSFPLM